MSTKAKVVKAAKAVVNATKPTQATKPTRKRPPQKIHIRESAKKDSDTLCGGSHSNIWNLNGDRPLQTVSPQKADDATCGRCIRVSKSPARTAKSVGKVTA